MSRIIVKNLPKSITEKKLKDLFSMRGCITDLQLKYTKTGVFRQFAFIGFKTEEEANAAKDYFHDTFVNTSKVKVEICTNLGDTNKPKSWKKQLIPEKIESKDKDNEKVKIKKSTKKKKFDDIPELNADPEFKEFIGLHKERMSKPVWAEDIEEANDLNSDAEDRVSSDEDSDPHHEHNVTNLSNRSAQERKKLVKTHEKNKVAAEVLENKTIPTKQVKSYDTFTVKIKNLPYQCKKSQVKKFFNPLKIISLRLPPKSKGFAYISFKTEKDMKQALNKNKGFLDGNCVNVMKYVKKVDPSDNSTTSEQQRENDKEQNEELLAETGRIFVRNLCYSVTEDEIKELFEKYGPLTEVHVPIDLLTKQAQGYAFVSYVFAEHAVKAFTELYGTIFQGRMLHLIPGKAKKEFKIDENETDFKKKKEAKRKEQSDNSDNWNILFLGKNAVVDVIAEKYSVEKSKLLSGDSKGNLAVRMALAETEMVKETRKFLIENGVQLDAFSQPAAERSKTVIVVKYLPSKTTSQEINDIFSKYGTISRVLVPPSGIVALVEFDNSSEAKTAFRKLVYTKFRYTPLFLEWAPIDSIKAAPVVEIKEKVVEIKEENEIESKVDNSTENSKLISKEDNPSTGTTVFVRNLNFSTTQENFENHFKQCGSILRATISTKKDVKTGKLLSMGFGFIQFEKRESAVFAIQNLQQTLLNGHALELKFANRSITPSVAVKRKKYEVKEQTSSKILVRNVPFQASESEIRNLFKEFGALQSVRLPKKLGAKSSEHRGFGFVEYRSADDAERAFESLCHSTHLYNRRLVLEWADTNPDDVNKLRKKTAHLYCEDGPKKKVTKSKLKEDVVLASARGGADDEEDGE